MKKKEKRNYRDIETFFKKYLFGCFQYYLQTQDLCCIMQDLPLQHSGSLVASGLSCLMACGILVP